VFVSLQRGQPQRPIGYAARTHGVVRIYFSFVSGLTIGYGDLVPGRLFTRVLAILIGLSGILGTALVAAIAVKALNATREEDTE
jgi:Ion channel